MVFEQLVFHARELAQLTYRVVAPPSLAGFVRGVGGVHRHSAKFGKVPAQGRSDLLHAGGERAHCGHKAVVARRDPQHHFSGGCAGDDQWAAGHGGIGVGGFDFTIDALTLQPGDCVLLFTDGITEAFSGDGHRRMFGVERLDEALRATNGRPDDIVESIHRSLFAHTQARTRADDQTLVAMQYVGPDRCLFPPVRAGV